MQVTQGRSCHHLRLQLAPHQQSCFDTLDLGGSHRHYLVKLSPPLLVDHHNIATIVTKSSEHMLDMMSIWWPNDDHMMTIWWPYDDNISTTFIKFITWVTEILGQARPSSILSGDYPDNHCMWAVVAQLSRTTHQRQPTNRLFTAAQLTTNDSLGKGRQQAASTLHMPSLGTAMASLFWWFAMAIFVKAICRSRHCRFRPCCGGMSSESWDRLRWFYLNSALCQHEGSQNSGSVNYFIRFSIFD